jgi:hypothetical protein
MELEDQDWLIARRREGWSGRRIATRLGVDPGRIRRALRQAGLVTRIEVDVPEVANVAWLTDRRQDRWPIKRIAAVLHADRPRVRQALQDTGLPVRLPPARREIAELNDLKWLADRRRER